jgi:hypothetical protein
VVVLRVYFQDYTNTSRFTKADVEGHFGDLNTLWGLHNSYNQIALSARVSDLYQLPDNRSDYIDDFPDGDLSNSGKYMKVLNDAVANAPSGLVWTNVDAVMVLMAETDATQFHRGQGNKCTLKMGPSSSAVSKLVGCAIFSENPGTAVVATWGRWGHEIGHALQAGLPAHPSNYNSNFELMDASYPGQTGMFEKWIPGGFVGWMPSTKYKHFTPTIGGGVASIYAEEYDPLGRPNAQAVKADITASLYYIISVRRQVNGDELRPIPDEGVLIERVVENGDASVSGSPWVVVEGKGGDRDKLWKAGDQYTNSADGIFILMGKKFDDDDYEITVRYSDGSNQPDVGMYSWLSPPGNTYETTDIWIDSPVNGYGTFRYGTWSDLHGGTVPKGNGDDPAVGQVNRIYARVRNFGTLAATNVVVHFDVTNPLGLGINGSNGFMELGSVDATKFAGLASIPPGGSTDVYFEWTPNVSLTPAQIAAGRFYFHSCVRIRMDHLPGEQVFGNQDGDGQQENIEYFEATQGPGAPPGQPYSGAIRLRNDDPVNPKHFDLNYKSDVPPGWIVDVNGGSSGVDLSGGEIRDIPVKIQQTSARPYGSVYGVDVFASSLRLLVNDKNPADKHPEFQTLGGVRVEARVVAKTRLQCSARVVRDSVVVTGRLTVPPGTKSESLPSVYVTGVRTDGRFAPQFARLVGARPGQVFRTTILSRRPAIRSVACMFAGTTTLSAAGASAPLPRQ